MVWCHEQDINSEKDEMFYRMWNFCCQFSSCFDWSTCCFLTTSNKLLTLILSKHSRFRDILCAFIVWCHEHDSKLEKWMLCIPISTKFVWMALQPHYFQFIHPFCKATKKISLFFCWKAGIQNAEKFFGESRPPHA